MIKNKITLFVMISLLYTYFSFAWAAERVTGFIIPYNNPIDISTRVSADSMHAGNSSMVTQYILWHNQESGDVMECLMDGITITDCYLIGKVEDINWKIVGLGDFNKDGQTDIAWQNNATGDIYIWYMNGMSVIGGDPGGGVEDSNWRVVGIGDLNADNNPDYLWQHQMRGDIYIWFVGFDTWWQDLIVLGGTPGGGVADPNWRIVDLADFNADGQRDYLWQNQATNEVYIWFIDAGDGLTVTGGTPVNVVEDTSWKIAGTGNFNSDGYTDLLLENQVSGDIMTCFMQDTTVTGCYPVGIVEDLNWKIVGAGPKMY